MSAMAHRLEYLLAKTTRPLSFVVFVPDWRKPLAENQAVMEASKYLRNHFVVRGRAHDYVRGNQHLAEQHGGEERFFTLPFDTHVYLLQNDEGAAKWPATPQFVEELKSAMENPFVSQRREREGGAGDGNRGRQHDRNSNDGRDRYHSADRAYDRRRDQSTDRRRDYSTDRARDQSRDRYQHYQPRSESRDRDRDWDRGVDRRERGVGGGHISESLQARLGPKRKHDDDDGGAGDDKRVHH